MPVRNGWYWLVFGATFLALAAWESMRPGRRLVMAEGPRWRSHALLLLLGAGTVPAFFRRTGPVLLALVLAGTPTGLFHALDWPFAVEFALSVALLDLSQYFAHRAHHAVPLLWRVHQVHHADQDIDVSTAGRTHPLEMFAMEGIYLLTVVALAPPAEAVLCGQLLSAFHNVFSHANVSLPARVERPARLVLITPDVHRIHHSVDAREHRSNFGAVFPWWDRLFGTYIASPSAGRDGLVAGLRHLRDGRTAHVSFLLALPFRRDQE